MAEKENKKAENTVDVQAFINRKLKAINEMPNKAKARALAERVRNINQEG